MPTTFSVGQREAAIGQGVQRTKLRQRGPLNGITLNTDQRSAWEIVDASRWYLKLWGLSEALCILGEPAEFVVRSKPPRRFWAVILGGRRKPDNLSH
jgi:hypothetical protein